MSLLPPSRKNQIRVWFGWAGERWWSGLSSTPLKNISCCGPHSVPSGRSLCSSACALVSSLTRSVSFFVLRCSSLLSSCFVLFGSVLFCLVLFLHFPFSWGYSPPLLLSASSVLNLNLQLLNLPNKRLPLANQNESSLPASLSSSKLQQSHKQQQPTCTFNLLSAWH